MKEPFENRQRFFLRDGHNQVRGDIVWINVEHQVRKNPKIERFLQTCSRRVKAFSRILGLHGSDRRKLLRIVAKRFRAVLRVIDFTHQPRMRDGDVVALEVVVDVNLPIAIEHVVAALHAPQPFKLKPARLLRNLAEK